MNPVRAEALAGRTIGVMEPEGGLTDAQRKAIEEAVQMMADGHTIEAQALLADLGFAFTLERVKEGRLVPA